MFPIAKSPFVLQIAPWFVPDPIETTETTKKMRKPDGPTKRPSLTPAQLVVVDPCDPRRNQGRSVTEMDRIRRIFIRVCDKLAICMNPDHHLSGDELFNVLFRNKRRLKRTTVS